MNHSGFICTVQTVQLCKYWLSFSIPFHFIAFHSNLDFCMGLHSIPHGIPFHSTLDFIPFHTRIHSIPPHSIALHAIVFHPSPLHFISHHSSCMFRASFYS